MYQSAFRGGIPTATHVDLSKKASLLSGSLLDGSGRRDASNQLMNNIGNFEKIAQNNTNSSMSDYH
jgi:hypothetical protein